MKQFICIKEFKNIPNNVNLELNKIYICFESVHIDRICIITDSRYDQYEKGFRVFYCNIRKNKYPDSDIPNFYDHFIDARTEKLKRLL